MGGLEVAVVAPDVTLEDYLRDQGIDTRRGSGSEVTACCFFDCNEGRASKRKLYLNVETWLWDCKVCGAKGGRRMLLDHFGDSDTQEYQERRNDPATRSKVLGEYCDMTEYLLLNNEAMLSYLFDRGLSPITIERARYGYVPRGQTISENLPSALVAGGFRRTDLEDSGMVRQGGGDFHSGKITIPYITGNHVVQIRGKDPKGKYFTPSGDIVRLYGIDDLRDADTAIITEGEFDRDLMKQHLGLSTDPRLRNIAVVGIPGAGALPGGKEGFPEHFRRCKRVYIMLDADETGRREAIVIKTLLGSIARIVELPNEDLTDKAGEVVKLDITEYLRPKTDDHPYGGHTVKDVAQLLHQADLVGKRIFSVTDATQQWRDDGQPGNAIPLGFPTLDAVMGGGLRVGNLCIPVAKTGVGKSVFLANVAWNVSQLGVPSVLFSLETTASEVYDILRRVARFHADPRMEEHDIATAMSMFRIVQDNRLTPEDFSLLLEDFKDEVGQPARLVMVDYLGYYARGRRGQSMYEKTSDAVMQLKAEAKDHRVAIISPHQLNRGAKEGQRIESEDIRDSGVVEETADWVLGLNRPGDAINRGGAVDSAMNVDILKGRRGGKGRLIQLGLSHLSLVMVDKNDGRKYARVQMENDEKNRGMKYDDWLRDQRGIANGREQMRLVE